MVSVRHIKRRDSGKNLRDPLLHLGIVDHPELVAETIGRHKIVHRFISGHDALDNQIHLPDGRVGEKHRLDIRILIADMHHPVLFLVRACQFVLFDFTLQIIVEMTGRHQSVLRPAVHRLGINIIFFRIVLHEPSFFAPRPEVFHGTGIHFVGMLVRDRRKVDFGFDNMQQRLFGSLLLRFGRVQHVVGTRCHLGGMLGRGTDPPERFYSDHSNPYSIRLLSSILYLLT